MSVNENHRTVDRTSVVPTDLANWLSVWQREFIFYQLDADCNLTFVSDSVREVLGLEPAEMIGRNARDFFDADHPLQSLLEDLADQRTTLSGAQPRLCVTTRNSGEIVYLGIRESIERDEAGVVVGRLGMAHDMTEHVTAELQLHESEQKYRRLVEGLGGDNIIFTRKPDGEMTYVSPSVKNVLGFESEEVTGINWRELIGEHFIGRADAELTDTWVTEGIHHHRIVVEISHAAGGTRLLEVQQHPVFNEEGEYIAMEGIAKDITQSTQTSQELQRLKDDLEQRVAQRTEELQLKNALLHESEARYRHVVEDQTEFVIRWVPGYKFSFVNGAYCRYFDATSEDLLGKSFLPTVYSEDRPQLEKVVAKLTPQHPIATVEHRVYRPDETIGWTQWTIRALFRNDGEVEEYQSVGRDVTDLKSAADTIREKELHLAHVSRLATMGELVAGIAHEVHQPLHAAKLFAEAARRDLEANLPNGTATSIDCMREISDAISRTAKIIRHIRAFATSKPAELEKIDVNQLVQESAEIISFEKRRAQVEVQFELEQGLPCIQGDRVQLEQACINLLMNGYEAMSDVPTESRQMLVKTYRDENHVKISFIDNGCGIEETSKDRLFDAFYTTKDQGMGMGLSLCKTIAESHAGKIWAEANNASGTTLVLALPAKTTD